MYWDGYPDFAGPRHFRGPDAVGDFMTAMVMAIVLSLIGLLVLLLMPKHVETTAGVAVSYPALSLGVGLLTWVVGIAAGTLLMVACGLGLLVFIALTIIAIFGWVVMGYIVGLRILAMSKKGDGHPVLAMLIGTTVITLLGNIPFGIEFCCLIGLLGAVFSIVISSMGVGATVLTRFGTRTYTRPSLPPRPPAPPAPGTSGTEPEVETGEKAEAETKPMPGAENFVEAPRSKKKKG
jgi:hypothetical protein